MKIKLLLFFCLLSSVIIGQGTGSVGVQSRFNKDVIVKWYDHQYQGGIWRMTPVFIMDSSIYLGPYPAVYDFVLGDVNQDNSTDGVIYAGDESNRKSTLGLIAQEAQLNLNTYGDTYIDTIGGKAVGGSSSIISGNDLHIGTAQDNKIFISIEDTIRSIVGDSNYWQFMTKFRDFDGTENDGTKVWGSDENGLPKWVDRGGGVDTITSYAALRALDNYSSDVIYVKDYTYTFNSVEYTTIGGLFYKSDSGTENGATVIVGNYIWKREWDQINVIPEWWEVGGYSYNGTLYSNKNNSGSTPGVIDGIYSDADRIRSAQETGSVLNLQKGKTYLIDIPIKGGIIHGNDAILKQVRPTKTALSSAYTANSTTVNLDDASFYRVGQSIMIVDNSATNGGIAEEENFTGSNSASNVITNISGNVVTISLIGNTVSMSIGDSVNVLNRLIFDNEAKRNSVIHNVTLDGNCPSNHITYDWRYGQMFYTMSDPSVYPGEHQASFYNCTFRNVSNSCVFSNNITLTNCYAEKLNGGLLHQSTSTDTNTVNNHVFIDGMVINGVGLIDKAITGHEESILTFSLNTKNVLINKMVALDVGNNIFGDVGVGGAMDENIRITNSSFTGRYDGNETQSNPKLLARIAASAVDTTLDTYSIIIDNSDFVNCGDLYLVGNNLSQGRHVNGVKITNSKFTNTRIQGINCSNISLQNNEFYHRPNYMTFTDFTWSTNLNSYTRSAFVTIMFSDRINIVNNTIEGDTSYNVHLDYGILIEGSSTKRLLPDTTSSDIYYTSNVKIAYNRLRGISYGIGIVARPSDNSGVYSNPLGEGLTLNYIIKDNEINMEKNSQYNANTTRPIWGIAATNFIEVRSNTIILPELKPTNPVYGILALGCKSADTDKYIGSFIIGNRVLGGLSSMFSIVNGASGTGSSLFNVVIKNNIVQQPIGTFGGTEGTNKYLDDNIVLPTSISELTNMITIPDNQYYLQFKDLY